MARITALAKSLPSLVRFDLSRMMISALCPGDNDVPARYCFAWPEKRKGITPPLLRSIARRLTALFALLSLLLALPAAESSFASNQSSHRFANFRAAQTNPIRLSPNGTRLFAVNTANNSLSVFDVTQPRAPLLLAQIPVGVGPVSVNPRSNDEAWVVNQVSNSVSVVSVSKGIVTDTIPTGARTEPMDVAFAGLNQAYVSYSRANTIAEFSTPLRTA